MMRGNLLLLIDIGNTYAKLALFDRNFYMLGKAKVSLDEVKAVLIKDGAAKRGGYGANEKVRNLIDNAMISIIKQAEALGVDLTLNTGSDSKQLDSIFISSVVEWMNLVISEYIEIRFGILPRFLGCDNHNLEVEASISKHLGSDLIAAAVGALDLYQADCIIVNCGTATTFSLIKTISQNEIKGKIGRFVGCLITPGIYSGFSGLISRAQALPMPWLNYAGNHMYRGRDPKLCDAMELNSEAPNCFYGTDTIDAMQKGGYYGFLAMVEGVIARLTSHFDKKPIVVLTGGSLNTFHKNDLEIFDAIDPLLVMKGLYYLATHITGEI